MDINWNMVGWIIDMILNGIIWLIIAAFLIPLIEISDKWTRKCIKFMDVADKWIRNIVENLFEWIERKNIKIISAFILMIILGILAQLGVIPVSYTHLTLPTKA